MNRLEELERLVRGLYEAKHEDRADWCDYLYENHVFIVDSFAREVSETMEVNPELARAAAMLHDIADAEMSRFADAHEERSKEIAREFLETAEFTQDEIAVIVDDGIELHGCYDGNRPKSVEGQIFATADALAHINSDFYPHVFNTLMADESEADRRAWVGKKIQRDFEHKICFDEMRENTRTRYEELVEKYT